MCPYRPEEGLRSPGTGIMGIYGVPYLGARKLRSPGAGITGSYGELYLGAGKQVLLTAEPAL